MQYRMVKTTLYAANTISPSRVIHVQTLEVAQERLAPPKYRHTLYRLEEVVEDLVQVVELYHHIQFPPVEEVQAQVLVQAFLRACQPGQTT